MESETNHIPIQKKITPTTVESVEVFGNTIYEVISRKEDLIWVMSRFQSVDQEVAGWTGFHQQVSSPERKDEVSIFTYRVSENQVSNVQEVLQQVKVKAESTGLKEGDVLLDHAICKLALEMLMDPKNKELKSFINL